MSFNVIAKESDRTRERLALVERYRRTVVPEPPERIGFMIIDMQMIFRDLWRKNDDDRRDLESLSALVRRARAAGIRIFRTQHGHRDPAIDGGVLHRWWGSSIIEGTKPHSFIPGFVPETNDIVIPKRRYSAFIGTGLHRQLQSMGITTLIIGGVMTNLCCETTARDAFCHDYNVWFLADGTATATEEMHRATLLNLAFGFAHILSCRQVAMRLEGGDAE